MLIEIEKSVLQYLVAKEKEGEIPPQDPVLRSLNALGDSIYQRFHLLTADLETLEYIVGLGQLDRIPQGIFQYFLDKYSFFDFPEIVTKRLVWVIGSLFQIDTAQENPQFTGCFFLDIEQNPCLPKKSKLICEDFRDCDLYIAMAKALHERNEYAKEIGLELESAFCGGSQAFITLEHTMFEKYFVFMVMDSDKKSKNDNFGKSAKAAVDYLEENPREILDLYILKVGEKENLIPPSWMLLSHDWEKLEHDLKEFATLEEIPWGQEILSYFDVKEGIETKKLVNFLGEFQDFLKKLDGEKNQNKNHFYGRFGKKVSEFFQTNLLEGGLQERLQNMKSGSATAEELQLLQSKINEAENFLDEIPEYVKSDWDSIYFGALDFGCGLNKDLSDHFVF